MDYLSWHSTKSNIEDEDKGFPYKVYMGWGMRYGNNGDIKYVPHHEDPEEVCVAIAYPKKEGFLTRALNAIRSYKHRKDFFELESYNEEKKDGEVIRKQLRFDIRRENERYVAVYSAIPGKFEEYLDDARDIGFGIK